VKENNKILKSFADTGGIVGLFLGCSLLSFVEILFFCFQGVMRQFNKTKKNCVDKIEKR
jgi:uncharacterized membrane protein